MHCIVCMCQCVKWCQCVVRGGDTFHYLARLTPTSAPLIHTKLHTNFIHTHSCICITALHVHAPLCAHPSTALSSSTYPPCSPPAAAIHSQWWWNQWWRRWKWQWKERPTMRTCGVQFPYIEWHPYYVWCLCTQTSHGCMCINYFYVMPCRWLQTLS